MTRKRLLLLGLLLAIASVPLAVYFLRLYSAKRLVNPAIYPAFRRIENYALRYAKSERPEAKELERCNRVVREYFHIRAKKDDYYPSDSEWYGYLNSLNFKLPPYLLEKAASREDRRWADEEEERLIAEQYGILAEYYGIKRKGEGADEE